MNVPTVLSTFVGFLIFMDWVQPDSGSSNSFEQAEEFINIYAAITQILGKVYKEFHDTANL